MDTDWCTNTIFSDWSLHHAPFFEVLDPTVDPALTKDLQVRLNNMVIELNRLIISATNNVNTGWTQQTVFVDTDTRYNWHRVCEQDNGQAVPGPAPNRLKLPSC